MKNSNGIQEIQQFVNGGKTNIAYRKITKLLKDRPNDRLLLKLQFDCLIKMRKYKKAINLFENSDLNPSDSTKLVYGLVQSYLRTNQIEKAKEWLFNSSILNENSFQRTELLCELNLISGDFKEAEKNSLILIDEYPDNSAGYYYLGSLMYSKKNYPEAIHNFKKAYLFKKEILYLTMIIESYICFHNKWFSLLNISLFILSLCIKFPLGYFFVISCVILRLWDILSGIVLKYSYRIKYAIITLLFYPMLIYFF